MRVIRWPPEKPELHECSVATLGVFDGVHRGHAAVIGRAVEAADERGCAAAIVTFDRHPGSVVTGRPEPAITSLDHRLRLFEAHGADVCLVIRFTEDVAAMPAERFVRDILWGRLNAELLVLGFDCRFGAGREGDLELCRRLGEQLGFDVEEVPPVVIEGTPVSSTAIRKAIQRGDLEHASRLLGRPFSLYGTVVPGDGRGAKLGYPSANLDLHNETVPPTGVYATWAYTDGQPLPSVTSVGRRPTFHAERDAEVVVETHILDFGERLYGQDLEVQFVKRLREQRTYDDVRALKRQMEKDVRRAKQVLEPGCTTQGRSSGE
ncbi:MAG: bifunctional riboflavin kinase/FAD synthetase [Planctomycetota bacterium]